MDKTKVIGTVLAIALVLGSGGYGLYKNNTPAVPTPAPVVPVNPDAASVVIKPTQVVAKVGELVVISAEQSNAKSYSWVVQPATKHFRVDKDGKNAVLTSDVAREYTITCAVAVGDTVDVKSTVIRFDGVGGPADLTNKVQEWAATVDSKSKKDEALKLGQSFTSIASALQSGGVSVNGLIEATKKSNNDALGEKALEAWKKPFLEKLAEELTAQRAAGKLADINAHIKVWQDIGNALKSYSASL